MDDTAIQISELNRRIAELEEEIEQARSKRRMRVAKRIRQ